RYPSGLAGAEGAEAVFGGAGVDRIGGAGAVEVFAVLPDGRLTRLGHFELKIGLSGDRIDEDRAAAEGAGLPGAAVAVVTDDLFDARHGGGGGDGIEQQPAQLRRGVGLGLEVCTEPG